MRLRAALLALLLAAAPLGAEQLAAPPAEDAPAAAPEPAAEASAPEAAAPDAEPGPLAAAGWCALRSREPREGAPGCDVGLGVALRRWAELAAVAVVGSKTLGLGAAWLVPSPGERPIAVSLGVVAPYDETGVDVRRWAIAVGATFGVGGPR